MKVDGTDLLVVGAGPAGLTVALEAVLHGASVRVVERRETAFRPSRALIVHPRTLEMLRPLGVTEALLARGDVSPSIHLHLDGRELPVRLGAFPVEDTAFPHLLFEPQAVLEAVLGDGLSARGVEVDRGVELTGLVARSDGVTARVRRAGSEEVLAARYLAGCDGADSTVRRLAGIGWRGAPYRHEVVLADLELQGGLVPGSAHAVPAPGGVLFVFPLGERATWRLLATRSATGPGTAGQPGPPVPAEELQHLLDEAGLGARVAAVAWSARVPLEHRLAAHYRQGPLFLVGDAAHVHSPAGGQGMNTAIQDAANLGWKLALAARTPAGSPSEDLLVGSYEAERRPVARRGLVLTGAIFWAEAGTDPVATSVRSRLLPLAAPLLPVALARPSLLATGIRLLSQLDLRYRASPLNRQSGSPARSRGPSGPGPGPRPGWRMPDAPVVVAGRPSRLHELLATPGIHVLLSRDAAWPCPGPQPFPLSVHRIEDWAGPGLVAIRPDGYVGLRSATGAPDELRRWLGLLTGRSGP